MVDYNWNVDLVAVWPAACCCGVVSEPMHLCSACAAAQQTVCAVSFVGC
jgi:hypothetical protein